MLSKVVAVQSRMGDRLDLEKKIHIFKQCPDFVVLPEYSLIDATITDFHRAALQYQENLDYLVRLSDELCICLVAGTVVEPEGERLFNTSFVINNGEILGRYRKRRPVPGELKKGINPGSEKLVLDVDGTRIAVLICGDVFFPELYEDLLSEEVDLIFVPTTSPFRPEDSVSQKHYRDQKYFVEGALSASGYVIKTCAVGEIFGHALQGRSLIAAPWGVLAQVNPLEESKERMLIYTLDVEEIREFRRKFLHRGRDESGLPHRPMLSATAELSSLDPEKLN